MSSLFLTILLTVLGPIFATSTGDLDAVVVVFRHGDRTPIKPYPTDPYGNRSYWSADWGMLTNLGKLRHYHLGQWFRQRYSDFLPRIYSEKDIYVRSTDVDRTLMSAESNLAGLFPPVDTDVWLGGFPWQPIPIHSIPETMDAVLAAKKPCQRYDNLMRKLFETPYFRNISHINHDLYAYLSRYSGSTVTNLKQLEYLYNTLKIEVMNNFTIPEWARKVFPDKMKPWAELSFATMTFTDELKKLKTGPFFNDLLKYFNNRTLTNKTSQYYSPKFLMFSAHDTTIANLLNTMGAFEYHCPPYTATIIFELRKTPSGGNFVNVFYKNSSEPAPVRVKGCEFDCEWENFKRILGFYALPLDKWDLECSNYLILAVDSLNFFILLGAVSGAVMAVTGVVLLTKRRSRRSEMYSQLPDEEYA
ncbi:prostatic acid phosphatase [Anthonomus grandis grandis]|uniref:prostatic acid phosphatase n=1 Tax=Anthonomus grandis grandis TaxID=2921223 RepID=UPI002166A1A0|nr:prostatic acid phosphatase [Anthonomus grandis grandis]